MKTVTICGSMKFQKEMQKIAFDLEAKHNMSVLQCVYNIDNADISEVQREALSKAHYRKIEISDAVYVVDIGGYIGNSVSEEIQFARVRGKEIILHSEYIPLSMELAEHQMNLYSKPFEMIKSGRKTIELRLWDEKRQKIKIGDIIVFTNIADGEKLKAAVVNLHRFSSFEELYRSLPLLKCGYTEDNIDMAKALDMEKYYSADEQKKYGVVGIELSSPKQIKD